MNHFFPIKNKAELIRIVNGSHPSQKNNKGFWLYVCSFRKDYEGYTAIGRAPFYIQFEAYGTESQMAAGKPKGLISYSEHPYQLTKDTKFHGKSLQVFDIQTDSKYHGLLDTYIKRFEELARQYHKSYIVLQPYEKSLIPVYLKHGFHQFSGTRILYREVSEELQESQQTELKNYEQWPYFDVPNNDPQRLVHDNRNSDGQEVPETGDHAENVYLKDCPFMLGKQQVEFFKKVQAAKERHTITTVDDFLKSAQMTESLDKVFQRFGGRILNEGFEQASDDFSDSQIYDNTLGDAVYQIQFEKFIEKLFHFSKRMVTLKRCKNSEVDEEQNFFYLDIDDEMCYKHKETNFLNNDVPVEFLDSILSLIQEEKVSYFEFIPKSTMGFDPKTDFDIFYSTFFFDSNRSDSNLQNHLMVSFRIEDRTTEDTYHTSLRFDILPEEVQNLILKICFVPDSIRPPKKR